MIEFEHQITKSEVDSKYINLTATDGKPFGNQIGSGPGSVLSVLDGCGRQFRMKRHNGNQLTRCSDWFGTNAVKPWTLITVRFDTLHNTLHLVSKSECQPAPVEPVGSITFARNGQTYEVRCEVKAGKFLVRGLCGGKPAGGFDF
jgi:hypothetical protein